MSYQSRLEDLYRVFEDLFFDAKIVHDCVMAYSIDNKCIARVELDENGDARDWPAMGRRLRTRFRAYWLQCVTGGRLKTNVA